MEKNYFSFSFEKFQNLKIERDVHSEVKMKLKKNNLKNKFYFLKKIFNFLNLDSKIEFKKLFLC